MLDIGRLKNLQNITIFGNPLKNIRGHVAQRGGSAVIELLRMRLQSCSEGSNKESNLLSERAADKGAPLKYGTETNQDNKPNPFQLLSQDIANIEDLLSSDGSLTDAKRFALKKDLALKKANLIRLKRTDATNVDVTRKQSF